jgi:hypothetical protein
MRLAQDKVEVGRFFYLHQFEFHASPR